MTTLGEGGAVTTNDPDFAEDVRQKKTFGYIYGKELRVAQVGFNYRMTKPQMAVGINQVNKIDRIISEKRENFIKLNKALADVPEIKPAPFVDENHGALMFIARVDSDKIGFCRDELRKILKEDWGVGTAHHYPAVWTWEALSNLGYTNEGCSVADKAAKEVISLPVFTSTTDEDIEYIVYALKESISKIKNEK
jgi:dTDP-4-amino-4,6-dideoxygalactose transaminase